MLIRNDFFLTIIRFTLPYDKLYLHIIQFISVLSAPTENRRTRSFSSIDVFFTFLSKLDLLDVALAFRITHSKNLQITSKLLTQGYRYHKLRKSFGKFFRSYSDLLSKFGEISLILRICFGRNLSPGLLR